MRLRTSTSKFPLAVGAAPAVIFALFVISGLFLAFQPKELGKRLEFWTFANTHINEYRIRVPQFEATHPGTKIDLKLVDYERLHDRLLTSYITGSGIPDLVEVEISRVGRFFRGTPSKIGFVELTSILREEGWMDKLVPTRFTPWSLGGHIYGIPHDIHPVVLLYRDDAYRAAGADPDAIETWEDFRREARKVTRDLDGDGKPDQYAIMLSTKGWQHFWMMLLQRGGGMFDPEGNIIIDSELAVDTLKFYCALLNEDRVAIPDFGVDFVSAGNFAAMKDGVILGVLAPDWYLGFVKQYAPELEGKWRARPMPVWEPGGRTTSTMGGTMLGITKGCRDFAAAWEFAKFIYFDREALVNRYQQTRIIPPLRDAWDAPVFAEPDPYLGGQKLGLLFTALAPSVPPVHLSPYWAEGGELFETTVFEATSGVKTPEQALKELAGTLRRMMDEDLVARAVK